MKQGKTAIFFILIGFIPAILFLQRFQRQHVFQEMLIMGTNGRISIVTDQNVDKDQARQFINDAFKQLKQYEQSWNYYSAESQISRINRTAAEGPVKLTADTFDLITQAIEFSELTDQVFDITAIALHPGSLHGNIILNASERTISFKDENTKIDLGGIAAGFAIDRVAEYLDAGNVENYLIDIGGDIYARGRNQFNELWQIGIRNPEDEDDVLTRVSLDNEAVTTSGNYVKNHIIDPQTGKPAESDIQSVTVIAPDCTQADVLATAFFIMGIEKTRQFLADYDQALEVLFIRKRGQQLEIEKLDRPVN